MQSIKQPKQNTKKNSINNENIKLNGLITDTKIEEDEKNLSIKPDVIEDQDKLEIDRGLEQYFQVIDKINNYLKETKDEFEKNGISFNS
jgi:hypothetical protein